MHENPPDDKFLVRKILALPELYFHEVQFRFPVLKGPLERVLLDKRK